MVIRFDKSKLVRSILISALFWIVPLLLEKIIYILGLSTFIWAILSSDVTPSNSTVLNTFKVIKTIENWIYYAISRWWFQQLSNRSLVIPITNTTDNTLKITNDSFKITNNSSIAEINKMTLPELVIYSQKKGINIKNIKGRVTKSKIKSLLIN